MNYNEGKIISVQFLPIEDNPSKKRIEFSKKINKNPVKYGHIKWGKQKK